MSSSSISLLESNRNSVLNESLTCWVLGGDDRRSTEVLVPRFTNLKDKLHILHILCPTSTVTSWFMTCVCLRLYKIGWSLLIGKRWQFGYCIWLLIWQNHVINGTLTFPVIFYWVWTKTAVWAAQTAPRKSECWSCFALCAVVRLQPSHRGSSAVVAQRNISTHSSGDSPSNPDRLPRSETGD